jgi:glycosyltransferase involved in cell wall biosynthesis
LKLDTTRVAVFTDNDFSKVNGVTTTLKALLRYAPADVQPRIYTLSDIGTEAGDYLALRAWGMPIPYYTEMSIYAPRVAAFRRHLRHDRIDLVHLTTPGPVGVTARHLASRASLGLVGSFHTHLADYARLLSGSEVAATVMRHYLRWVYRTCATVMVPSEDAGRRLIDDGWRADRLMPWTRGVDVRTFRPTRRSAMLREHWRVCERRPALLYVGRVSREKDLAMLPSLLSALHARQCPCRLIVVGGGPMLPELRAACGDAVFTGTLTHDDVAVAMASADLFVFPSTTDTAGNVVLEAQASGLPVVVSDRGGPQENMVDGETGMVCRGGDPSSFAVAVQSLTDPARRLSFGTAARRYTESRSWEASLRPVYALYRAAHRRAAAPRSSAAQPALQGGA